MASNLQRDQSNDLLYVKKGNVYCGYRREYLSQNLTKMEERYVSCKKCSGIMRKASLSNEETSCLVCSETPKQPNPVKDVQESIETLGIKCPLLRNCDWKGEVSEAETHLEKCLFFQIQCKKCEQIFARIDREEHEDNSCPKRLSYCEYCGRHGEAEDRDKHLLFCDEYPIYCPNECGAEFSRQELSQHRSECELEVVTCPYKEYGCRTESMLRRDLLAHKKENIVEHTDMSLVEIKQLKTENFEMKWKIKSMKQLDGVEWEIKKIDGFKTYEETEGPTFYVNNYKLRIYRVYRYTGYKSSFYLKMIEGKVDRNSGFSCITHYRLIQVYTRDYNESVYKEGTMNYQLKIGTKSEEFGDIYFITYPCLLKFYFDFNRNDLESYSQDYPPIASEAYDPWKPNIYYGSD